MRSGQNWAVLVYNSNAGSKPSDKRGTVIRGEGGMAASKNCFFRLFGPQFGLKIRGRRAFRRPTLDPSLNSTIT